MAGMFDEFLRIAQLLNMIGICPVLMGSLGLEYISGLDWHAKDIDIHVPGDPRGWDAPDDIRINRWNDILNMVTIAGYHVVDVHEHEITNGSYTIEFGVSNSLLDFAGISSSDIPFMKTKGASFYLPTLEQYLSIYSASAHDSYRSADKVNRDKEKILYLRQRLKGLRRV